MKKRRQNSANRIFVVFFIHIKFPIFPFYSSSSSTPKPNNAKSPNVGSSGKIVFI